MKKVTLLMIASTLALSACSQYATHGDNIYLRNVNGNELVIPAPLTQANISHFYDLPSTTSGANVKVSIVPPAL